MDKQALRREMKRRFAESDPNDRSRWSDDLCMRLYRMRELSGSNVVMAFHPLSDEVDIRPLLKRLHDDGKIILLPEVTGESTMILRQYAPEAEMLKGALGTQVPNTGIYTEYSNIEVVLVPGVAFDKEGHRMGRGKGYYDRFLSMIPEESVKIGVCFPYQIVECVPTEEHDFVMDYV